jgi:hypothetical protein
MIIGVLRMSDLRGLFGFWCARLLLALASAALQLLLYDRLLSGSHRLLLLLLILSWRSNGTGLRPLRLRTVGLRI